MDFSLFPTVLSKKEPNIAQEKSESAEMWKIQLIWGFWWHYKSGGGLYKFGGGSRMAVTSNCVNEKKFFPVGIRRGDPKYSNSYQLIPVHCLMKAVEAVKEKFYCFLGIVHPTYYQSRGWGPWLVFTSRNKKCSHSTVFWAILSNLSRGDLITGHFTKLKDNQQ